MDTSVPFVHNAGGTERWGKYDDADVEYQGLQWAGEKELRPSTSSPLYSSLHELAISLTCTYDLEGRGGNVAKEKLSFKVPVTFARVASRLGEDESTVTAALPVYSQLYDMNGDRRIDYSTPLPLYTPRTEKGPAIDETETLLTHTDEEVHAPPVNTGSGTVNVYHGVNDLDSEADKRFTPVLVQEGQFASTGSSV